MTTTTGKCLCGQITVSITREAFDATDAIALCYCKNCRQSSGAIASTNVRVPDAAVTITGQPKIYQDSNTGSGTTIQRAFCTNCGSPIYTATPAMPGLKIIKLGLFDEIPKPAIEFYCKTRPSWIKPVDSAKQFDVMPTI